MSYGFIIPVYNHGATLESVVQGLKDFNLPIIVVDDGNNAENKKYIIDVAQKYNQVVLVQRAKNGGKGKALNDGILKANEIGLTHILQIDSDGQHDVNRVAHFLQKSKENPDAIICGYPEYDATAPKKRVNGRKFANGWIHFVTLSKDIKDSMIGFRVYPVAPFVKLIKSKVYIDSRMGYDIEVLVRLYWRKVPIISESVKVFYPSDGVSNFRYIRDTLRISGTYARLCLGLFVRFPILIYRNCKKAN